MALTARLRGLFGRRRDTRRAAQDNTHAPGQIPMQARTASGGLFQAGLLPGDLLVERLDDLRLALRSAQKTCLTLACLCLLAFLGLAASLILRPAPVYFGMSQDMRLLPMTPLTEPLLSEPALKTWVAFAVAASFNLDYLHWRSQLTAAREHFTNEAFTRFALSLDSEGHLPLLRQQRALMHAVPRGTPVVTRSGVHEGVMQWEFEVPILLTFETSAGRIANTPLAVVCRVRRVSTAEHARGVAISSLVAMRESVRSHAGPHAGSHAGSRAGGAR